MRMSIFPEQGYVSIDGINRGPLALDLDPTIRVVQWIENRGWIEFKDPDGEEGPAARPPNEPFTDIDRFRPVIDAWSAWTPSTPPQDPASPVPIEITNFQARAVLHGVPGSAEGRSLFDDVDDALRAQGGMAWQAWEYANTITRNGSLVNAMATQFGISDAQMDAMFTLGATISA